MNGFLLESLAGYYVPQMAPSADFQVLLPHLQPDEFSAQPFGCYSCGSGAAEGIHNKHSFRRGCEHNSFKQVFWLLGGMLSFFFFRGFGQAPGPDILHLLAAVYLLHQLIIEKVMGFPIRLLRPENGFRGMSEAAADWFSAR